MRWGCARWPRGSKPSPRSTACGRWAAISRRASTSPSLRRPSRSDAEAHDPAADEQRDVEIAVRPDRGAERIVLNARLPDPRAPPRREIDALHVAAPAVRADRRAVLRDPREAALDGHAIGRRVRREPRPRRDLAGARGAALAPAAREPEVRHGARGIEDVELVGRLGLTEVVAPVVGHEKVLA